MYSCIAKSQDLTWLVWRLSRPTFGQTMAENSSSPALLFQIFLHTCEAGGEITWIYQILPVINWQSHGFLTGIRAEITNQWVDFTETRIFSTKIHQVSGVLPIPSPGKELQREKSSKEEESWL